jgi:hypothetical protein
MSNSSGSSVAKMKTIRNRERRGLSKINNIILGKLSLDFLEDIIFMLVVFVNQAGSVISLELANSFALLLSSRRRS